MGALSGQSLCVLSLWLCWAGVSVAGESFGGGKPPRAEALFTEHPPTVDGAWSEGEWAAAKPLFFSVPGGDGRDSSKTAQARAQTGQPSCEVRFLWTKEGVYVTFRTRDANPVYGDFKPGEPLYLEDVLELFIDQTGDHRQYYEIQIDPAAQVFIKNYLLTAAPQLTPEKRLTQEFVESEFWRYDLPKPDGFRAASKLDAQTHQWTLEVFLPASFVNRRRGGGAMQPCTWRINLVQHDWDAPGDVPNREPKFMYWAPVLPGHPHLSPRAMGWLELKKP